MKRMWGIVAEAEASSGDGSGDLGDGGVLVGNAGEALEREMTTTTRREMRKIRFVFRLGLGLGLMKRDYIGRENWVLGYGFVGNRIWLDNGFG